MAKKSTIRTNWPKTLLQLGILAALVFFLSGLATKLFPGMETPDPEKYCPYGGLEALATYIQRGSLPCSMTSLQIVMGIALAAIAMLVSKLFCAYICPIGTIEDLLIRLRKAIGFKGISIKNGSIADKVLRIVKYALLYWIFYMTISSSELFCKNLDPYYAVATGFKGEITMWMALITVSTVILLGVVIDRFWCKYICPLGAISNSIKFWISMVSLTVVFILLSLVGLAIHWAIVLGAFCLAGYLLEILCGKPKAQLLYIVNDESKCSHCNACSKACPYNIDITKLGSKVNSVDCTLCGECVASCTTGSLSIGLSKPGKPAMKYAPAIITIAVAIVAFVAGNSFELPTISETWDIEEGMELQEVKIENLRTVKCFSSSMAFKARMEKVKGVHGVKTYVGSHTVVVAYDPKTTTAEKIQEAVFTPSHYRAMSPDPKVYPEVKVVTIRTEHMHDKTDLSYLGIQFKLTDKGIFGLDSEYDCPLVVHVYMDPAVDLDEEYFRQVVEKKSLDMETASGTIKSTPVDFEFVRLEKGYTTMPTSEYLKMMFDGFHAEYNGRYQDGDTMVVRKRSVQYADQPQFIVEVADPNFEKTVVTRALPYLSNHVSREEGVISMDLTLNKDFVPCFQFRFAAPATAERIYELMTMDTWTITYSTDDVREEPARLAIKKPFTSFPVED